MIAAEFLMTDKATKMFQIERVYVANFNGGEYNVETAQNEDN